MNITNKRHNTPTTSVKLVISGIVSLSGSMPNLKDKIAM